MNTTNHTTYFNVLIADDEAFVRGGLKYIIDWEDFGFCICGEAENGQEALDKIHSVHPDLILLDIRMPVLTGMELIEKARESGYTGEFIILSGYSDFQYAQTALKYGVSYYLTKPINEEKLKEAVTSVREKIQTRMEQETSMHQYFKKAKSSILYELVNSPTFDATIPYHEFGLDAPIYQVILYEDYTPFYSSYNFAEMLRGTNPQNDYFEQFTHNNRKIILLKGFQALNHFKSCLEHYKQGTQKGSPLDSVFLAVGRTVRKLSDIYESYQECQNMMERRFFCEENQHVISHDDLPKNVETTPFSTSEHAEKYGSLLTKFIKSYNKRMMIQTLSELKEEMLTCPDQVVSLKHFLTDIFIQVKQNITLSYNHVKIPLQPTALIIRTIENKYYLYEILSYFSDQFEMFINAIGGNSSDSVLDDILYYIDHNYADSLKLETIAPMFGYNSSYLGKLFTQRMGKPFNNYLDEIRIQHSMDYLVSSQRKIYEIAALCGYKNVNYFHQKFKKVTGLSPAEYRKLHS